MDGLLNGRLCRSNVPKSLARSFHAFQFQNAPCPPGLPRSPSPSSNQRPHPPPPCPAPRLVHLTHIHTRAIMATDQIRQMVNFILQEAHEKANEIRVKVSSPRRRPSRPERGVSAIGGNASVRRASRRAPRQSPGPRTLPPLHARPWLSRVAAAVAGRVSERGPARARSRSWNGRGSSLEHPPSSRPLFLLWSRSPPKRPSPWLSG